MSPRTTIVHADALALLGELGDNELDALVTDPPYGMSAPPDMHKVLACWLEGRPWNARGGGFMGADWDAFVPGPELWREVLRVLKPGAYAVVFAAPRTVDLMGLAMRLGGFEIRDQLSWIFGTGFPKSLDIPTALATGGGPEAIRKAAMGDGYVPSGRARANYDHGGGSVRNGVPFDAGESAWQGYGTALKPGHEPIILARKPLDGTYAENVAKWGTSGLNINGCRIEVEDTSYKKNCSGDRGHSGTREADETNATNFTPGGGSASAVGRWPANVAFDEEGAALLDEQTGNRPGMSGGGKHKTRKQTIAGGGHDGNETHHRADTGGASRFFFTAKASRAERDAGLAEAGFEPKTGGELTKRQDGAAGTQSPRAGAGRTSGGLNSHSTVKPLSLMRWLIRLVTPPGDAEIIDPFVGSGTTAAAAVLEGVSIIASDQSEEFVKIAEARAAYWAAEKHKETQ